MTSDNNDKNWNQVKETVLLINVAVARIEHAMLEGNDSFTDLSESFVEIVNAANQLSGENIDLANVDVKQNIKDNCQEITKRVESSIIAFQFYDRLSQRMALVSKTLNSLTEILADPEKPHIQEEWIKLQNMIRSKYTLDADQQIFDDVLNGMPIEQALQAAAEKTTDNDIEFF